MAIDIVSICYSKEIYLQELQINSVDLFFDLNFLKKYLIIINDEGGERDESYKFLRQKIDDEVSEGLKEKVELVFSSQLIGNDFEVKGWSSQQLLKLESCKYIDSECYLCLDSKNHFIKKVFKKDFFDKNGFPYARAKKHRLGTPQFDRLKSSFSFFNAESFIGDDDLIKAGVTVTPYLFIRRYVEDMLLKAEKEISDHFLTGKSDVTEFFLYYAYVDIFKGGYFSHYSPGISSTATLFKKHPRSESGVEDVINMAKLETVYAFGVHRERFQKLNDQQIELVFSMWKEKGLLKDKEQESRLLTLKKN